MPLKVLRIDVFISSPSDVAQEREIVRRVIERLNRSVLRDHFFVVPLLYEDDVPPQVGQDAQVIVDRFMHVQRSQLMVCMIWSRMGTPFTIKETGDHFESGTQYEFIQGYENFVRRGYPRILLYRRARENPEADPVQRDRVKAFFKGFEGEQSRWKGLWGAYDDLPEFEEKVRNDLERVIRGLGHEQSEHNLIEQPEFGEEARRLDAAMPGVAVLGEPTEVRAMICLPESEGLAALFPQEARDERDLSRKDVRAGDLMIAFPKDSTSGELRPTTLAVEFEAPDFEIRQPRQSILLSPRRDSATVSVFLTPQRVRPRSSVIVRVKGKALDGGEYLCGSAVLHTTVEASTLQRITHSLWRLVSTQFGERAGQDAVEQRTDASRQASQRARDALQRATDAIKSRPSGREPAGRASRSARWVLLCSGGGALLREIGLLGGEVAFLDRAHQWWYVSNLHTSAPTSVPRDIALETRTYWVLEGRVELEAFTRRLALTVTPEFLLVLLSADTEAELLRLERAYQGAEEEDIASTVYRIKTDGETIGIEVASQTLS